MRWRISYSPAAAERSTLGMRLTVCPTLNLCITILSILISGCYISLARAAEALSKSAYSVGFLLIILDVKKLRERGPPRRHLPHRVLNWAVLRAVLAERPGIGLFR